MNDMSDIQANPLLQPPSRPMPRHVAIIGAGSIGPDIGYYLKSALPSIALTMIDFDTQLLPDDLTLPLVWGGLLFNLWGVFVTLESAVIGGPAGIWSSSAVTTPSTAGGSHRKTRSTRPMAFP